MYGVCHTPTVRYKTRTKFVSLKFSLPPTIGKPSTVKSYTLRKSDPPLKYEALSYTWGDASKLKPIIIGASHEFYVTSNCYDALRRLRDHDGKRLIWIDAICINQEDDAERTQQIGIMGEIYGCASQVLVYLGEADQNSKRVFDHVAQLQLYSENHTDAEGDPGGDFMESLPMDSTLVEATTAVLRRPWFNRV
jgi:hypothetical protein